MPISHKWCLSQSKLMHISNYYRSEQLQEENNIDEECKDLMPCLLTKDVLLKWRGCVSINKIMAELMTERGGLFYILNI